MPRGAKPSLIPKSQLELHLPQELRDRLDIFLYSPLENRVPKGAYREFFSDRLREFFLGGRLSLEQYGLPGGLIVGSPEAIQTIRNILERSSK